MNTQSEQHPDAFGSFFQNPNNKAEEPRVPFFTQVRLALSAAFAPMFPGTLGEKIKSENDHFRAMRASIKVEDRIHEDINEGVSYLVNLISGTDSPQKLVQYMRELWRIMYADEFIDEREKVNKAIKNLLGPDDIDTLFEKGNIVFNYTPDEIVYIREIFRRFENLGYNVQEQLKFFSE